MAAEAGEGGHSPLEQFEIHELVPIHIGDLNLSYTNSALWMSMPLPSLLLQPWSLSVC